MTNLSEREITILKLLANGGQNKIIAKELNLSVHTVKVYITAIIKKLDAKNRTEAAFIAGKTQIVE